MSLKGNFYMKRLFFSILSIIFLISPVFSQEENGYIVEKRKLNTEDYIYFYGEINYSSVNEYNQLIKTSGIKNLFINSDGGVMLSGIDLGKLLRDHQIKIQVQNCFSACAFALMSSTDRIIGNPVLYFHEPFFFFMDTSMSIDELVEISNSETLKLVTYFLDNDYSITFLKQIFANTSNENFIAIDIENLKKFKVGFNNKNASANYSIFIGE